MALSSLFETFTFDGQKNTRDLGLSSDALFPLAIRTQNDGAQLTLEESIKTLTELSRSGEIFHLVRKHGGAVLIRGLPIKTPNDYSAVVHGFGFRAHEEVGRPPNRTVLAKNVKTANEGPPKMPIWPHNEYGWSTVNPAWLTFSNFAVPVSGGETPINSSIALALAIREQAPEFYQELLNKGVQYIYRYSKDVQAISNVGNSVTGAYGQLVLSEDDPETARKKIEREVQRHSNRWQWHENGDLSVTHVVPIIRKHNEIGLPTFFGNLTSAYGRSKHHGATEPPFLGDDGGYHPLPTYGDGSPIPTKYLDLALSIAESSQVFIKWVLGDIVLIDNYAVMHSRNPWEGDRRVLAALWDEDGRISDFEQGVEILTGSPREPIVAQ